MQTRLGKLRGDLARLQHTRKLIRWGNGFSLLVTALIVALIVAFVADVTLDMSRLQRVVLLALVVASAVWSFRRFTKPWLRQSEDLVEVALLVERQQQIDCDLVAAMQFEQPEATSWGSTQLQTAVVTRVAEISPKLNVFAGFSQVDFQRRLTIASVLVIAVAISWVASPDYINAFFSRLMLANAFYPTNTQITKVVVNQVSVFDRKVLKDEVATPFGQSVKFEVEIGGQLPTTLGGKLRVQSLDGSIATDVELMPPSDGDAAKVATLRGELPRLMDSVLFEVFVGDARTVPFKISAVPLPIVDVRLKVTSPSYASVAEVPADAKGAAKWHLSVIEGSRVDVELESLNSDLDSAKLWIGEHEFALTPQANGVRVWSLKPEGTPLASISEALEFKLQVTDKQGLQLEAPIRGTIRLRQDLPPRIAVSSRTSRVIPTAGPPILYSVQDDYSLSKVVAQVQVSRQDAEVPDREFTVLSVPDHKPQTIAKGTYKLDLTPLKLAKGDELKVTFVAYDYRGTRESKKSFSEPLLFQVTDQQGILSGLLETDQESAKQLDAIIRRELGIGKEK